MREPIKIVEIDLDYCDLTYGTSPCAAILGDTGAVKCFNTFHTCQDGENFAKGVKTYRYIQGFAKYPKGGLYFPYLVETSSRSSKANIAGADPRLDSLGQRGTITATFIDAPHHDRGVDKYARERITGDALASGIGYNPMDRGTHFGKLKARNPNYAGRPMREITGYVDGGVLTVTSTRHFVITDFAGPDADGNVTIEGMDILALASNDRAVMPKPNQGQLNRNITASEFTFDLTPEGIGDAEYPASGFAAIGSELVAFARSGDTITLTQRGVSRTVIAAHNVNDTFQITYSPRRRRIDLVLYDLLSGAGVSDDFLPVEDWAAEVERWAPSLVLSTDIMKPEGVTTLIGELANLGLTVWWDEIGQEVRLQINRPVDTETTRTLTDRNNIREIRQEDMQDERKTEVIFKTVQIDPSRGVGKDNFLRTRYTIDATSKLPQSYGDTRIKEIYCRWLNYGNDSLVRLLSLRLLNRFKDAPKRYYLEVDINDDMGVVGVARIESRVTQNPDGDLQPILAQVIMREDKEPGHSVALTLQRFQFDQRYGFITENDRTTYTLSSDAQRARGCYLVDDTLQFGDGTGAYRMI